MTSETFGCILEDLPFLSTSRASRIPIPLDPGPRRLLTVDGQICLVCLSESESESESEDFFFFSFQVLTILILMNWSTGDTYGRVSQSQDFQ